MGSELALILLPVLSLVLVALGVPIAFALGSVAGIVALMIFPAPKLALLATAGYDHKIRFWEASREKCTRVLRYLDSQVNALSITNDKQYIAAVYDMIRLPAAEVKGWGLPGVK